MPLLIHIGPSRARRCALIKSISLQTLSSITSCCCGVYRKYENIKSQNWKYLILKANNKFKKIRINPECQENLHSQHPACCHRILNAAGRPAAGRIFAQHPLPSPRPHKEKYSSRWNTNKQWNFCKGNERAFFTPHLPLSRIQYEGQAYPHNQTAPIMVICRIYTRVSPAYHGHAPRTDRIALSYHVERHRGQHFRSAPAFLPPTPSVPRK